ncbi:uncharacterized protein IL334_003538 [Kwoniella shivajii]|uniref:F-box domain-containing protein n=1 Tax=Kwoniella shivajii TaxID=564305 RepID=A0ABZ1CXV1_9TREE|nr:hypothetical protein IL334_003538 [Kwoniella shivajii]
MTITSENLRHPHPHPRPHHDDLAHKDNNNENKRIKPNDMDNSINSNNNSSSNNNNNNTNDNTNNNTNNNTNTTSKSNISSTTTTPPPIFKLHSQIVESIFRHLKSLEIVHCAQACRQWNKLVRKSVYLQLMLRQHMHQSQSYDGERDFPAGERLRRLLTRETNIDLLRPRITEFDLPQDQFLHSVAGKYVVTQPVDQPTKLEKEDKGKWTLCTVWVHGKPTKVKVDFKPYTDLFDVDIHNDVIIVQEDEGHGKDAKTNLNMRILHLFNQTEDAEPYERGGFRIREEGWDGEEPHNVSLTAGQRVMIWCGGIAWIYDWGKGERLGRLPPVAPAIWESNLGMAWAGKGIALGLDMPHNPAADVPNQAATLAVFEVDTTYPGTSSLPLLLELPFCADLLDSTVRDLLDLPESATVVVKDQDHIPFLQRNGPFGLILVATEFVINEDIEWRLVIVLPTSRLQQFKLEKRREIPPPDVAWGDEWDPFAGINPIPYAKWSKHSYTWCEPISSPSYYQGFYEAQNSLRLYNYNYELLKRHGLLRLSVLDFNQRRLRGLACDFRNLGGLGRVGELTNQSDDPDRRKPIRYRRDVIRPVHEVDDGNLGCTEISGDFVLGQSGIANVILFDGERLFLQQKEAGKCWILDFGVREIAGKAGEAPEAENKEKASD